MKELKDSITALLGLLIAFAVWASQYYVIALIFKFVLGL